MLVVDRFELMEAHSFALSLSAPLLLFFFDPFPVELAGAHY